MDRFITFVFAVAACQVSAFEEGTLAFYGFNEGKGGAQVDEVVNAVDPARYPGSVRLVGVGTPGDLLFDDDVPARYLYEGIPTAGSVPVCSGWKSVNAPRQGAEIAGGAIDFEALATRLSSNETFTIEFFYKIPQSEAGISRNEPVLSFDLQSDVYWRGENKSCGAHAMELSLMYPENGVFARPRLSTDYGWTQTYRTFLYSGLMPKLPDLADGEWHHIAIVCEEWGKKYSMWCDYYPHSSLLYGTGSMTPDAATGYSTIHAPQTVSRPLSIFNGAHRGKIAGLRVSTNVLTTASFLRAFDFPSTDTVFHWRLDGEAGEQLPDVLTNAAPSFSSSLANQFYRLGNVGGLLGRTGNGLSLSTDGKIAPSYTNATWKARVGVGEEPLGKNCSSAAFVPSGSSLDVHGLRTAVNALNYTAGGDFTFECFARFDYEAWRKRIGSTYANADDPGTAGYLTLFGYKGEAGGIFGRLYFIAYTGRDYRTMNLTLTLADDNSSGKTLSLGIIDFTKWHHYAWVYDADAKTVKVYVDKELKASAELTHPLKFPGDTYFFAGATGSAPTFEGGIDEVRFSRVCLEPSEFLCPMRSGMGLNLFLR